MNDEINCYKIQTTIKNKLLNLMGSGQDLVESRSSTPFDQREWQVDDQPTTTYLGNFITLKNIHTKKLIDQYELFFSSEEDYKNYLESFKWRQKDPHVVRTYHYETRERGDFCSSAYSIVVYIHHPKARLSDFRDIPYPDTLYCMMAMLEGYKKIFDKIGRFYLAEEQVCIDEDGEIRVWVNSDLSKNYPEIHSNQQINSHLDEEEQMVEEIFKMVMDNADPTEEPEIKFMEFLQKERKKRKLTFEEGKSIVHDYASHYHQHIPNILEAVLEIFGDGRASRTEDQEEDDGAVLGPVASQKPISPVGQNAHFLRQGAPIHEAPRMSEGMVQPPIVHQRIVHSPPPPAAQRQMNSPPNMRTPINNPPFVTRSPMIQQMPPVRTSEGRPFYSPPHHVHSPRMHTPPAVFHPVRSPPPIIQNVPRHSPQKIPPNFTQVQGSRFKNFRAISHDSSDVEEQIMRDLMEMRKKQQNQHLPTSSSPYQHNPFANTIPINPNNFGHKNYPLHAQPPFSETTINPKKSMYYTLGEEKELDPEIAADLLLYI